MWFFNKSFKKKGNAALAAFPKKHGFSYTFAAFFFKMVVTMKRTTHTKLTPVAT